MQGVYKTRYLEWLILAFNSFEYECLGFIVTVLLRLI